MLGSLPKILLVTNNPGGLSVTLTSKVVVYSPAERAEHRVHRVATAGFWRTFHHEGKISPAWCWVGGACPLPTPFHYIYHHQ
jgi:hypothetical protein